MTIPLTQLAAPRTGPARFRGRDAFRSGSPYYLLPFRFERFSTDEVLLVNEAGEHIFLPADDFARLTSHELRPDDDAYLDLKGKHFLADSESLVPLELLAVKARTKRAHLQGFTKLHIFVVTLRCEHTCQYCQVSRVTQDRHRFDMTEATARKAVAFAFRAPAERIKIEFQGGEPLLNFDRIVQIVREAKALAGATGRQVDFVVASNIALLTDDMLDFFREEGVSLSISLDGPAFIHNANRPRPGGNSYEVTVLNLAKARTILGAERVAALMTTTRLSLDHPREIVDEYARQGFHAIFLRSLSPYGFALKTARRIAYETDRFLSFYAAGLDRVIELNRGGYHLVEVYAQLLLRRILTPYATGYVDLQSPAGAGIGVAVYNYDGDVYASDEGRMLAEMGDTRFRLGNLHRNSYAEVFGGEWLRELVESSCIESLPGCSDCVFQPWCGADPVFNYATQGDIVGHRPDSDFHHRNAFVFRHLLERYRSDEATRRVIWSWVRGTPSDELFPEAKT